MALFSHLIHHRFIRYYFLSVHSSHAISASFLFALHRFLIIRSALS
jgi:hypothetical protein